MARYSLAFEQPYWQSPQRNESNRGPVLLRSASWLLCYVWLGFRLWTGGFSQGLWLNIGLTLLCIGLGVIVVLDWRALAKRRWQQLYAWLNRQFGNSPLPLEQLQALTPSEFEAYVAYQLFERHGYQVVNSRDTKDGGIDIVITDSRGQQAIVQCKRYRGTVGEPTIRDLYGTMIHAGATHAYLITTARFSAEAQRWVQGKPITLVDGPTLVELTKQQVPS